MPYTDLEKLTERFGEQLLIQLTDRAEIATGLIDTDVIDRALEDTDALIDGYAAVRYALPMETTPALLSVLALDIAIYKLHVYTPDDKITADYEAAMKSLMGVSTGAIRLPVAGVEAPSAGTGSGVRITDRERDLTASKMTGFI